MGILQIVFFLAIIGFCVYLVNVLIPMPPVFKQIINAVVAFAVVFYLLQVFGVIPHSVIRIR